MIKGTVKTINVTSSDLELIDFMLTNNEKVASKMHDCATKAHMEILHSDLRKVLVGAK